MDMIVTFEDGSTAYLEHHGIKGMKWGVWNDETRARRMGGGLSIRKKSGSGEASSSGGYKGPKLTDEQKAIMKKAAIGLGTAAAIGGGVYLAKKAADAGIDAKYAKDMKALADFYGVQRKSIASDLKNRINDDIKEDVHQKAKDFSGSKTFNVSKNFTDSRRSYASMYKARKKSGTFNYPEATLAAGGRYARGQQLVHDVLKDVYGPVHEAHAKNKARIARNRDTGKLIVNTMFAAGRGAAIGTAVGTVLGTASNINAAKNKTAISKTTGKKYTIKSTNPDPKKYEVWDPTLSKSENLKWNKEHKSN